MPRFFFDLQDGELIPDHTGVELDDHEAAQAHAVSIAEMILRERARNGRTHSWHVIVKDSGGEQLDTVTSVSV